MHLEKSKRISLSAILIALQTILLFIEQFLPMISFIIIIVLPIFPLLIFLYGPRHSGVIYLFASFFLAFILQNNGLESCLFTLFPAILVGFLQGIIRKKKQKEGSLLFFVSCSHFLLSILLIPLIYQIYHVSLVDTYQVLFHLPTSHTWDYFLPIFFIISSLQTLFTSLVMDLILKEKLDDKPMRLGPIFALFCSLFSMLCYWLLPLFSHLLFVWTIYLSILSISYLKKKKRTWIILIIFIIITAVIYILFQSKTPSISSGFYMLPFYVFLSIYELLAKKFSNDSISVKINKRTLC